MNVLKLQNGSDSIELSVSGYEFEKCTDSLEWLMVYGKVTADGETVEGEDPTIETADVDDLKIWAQNLIDNRQNSVWETIEPNLYFGYNKDSNILEIYFCPERDFRRSDKKVKGLVFKKECTHSDLESIISWCNVVIKAFPKRNIEENKG